MPLMIVAHMMHPGRTHSMPRYYKGPGQVARWRLGHHQELARKREGGRGSNEGNTRRWSA